MPNLKSEVENALAKAGAEWGFFRKWIALHPLTTFWLTLVAGLVIGRYVGPLVS